jgi:hypothetical protein
VRRDYLECLSGGITHAVHDSKKPPGRRGAIFIYPWLARMRPVSRSARWSIRWITHTQAWWLPTKACDLYLRRLHSGFPRGPERKKGGWDFWAKA